MTRASAHVTALAFALVPALAAGCASQHHPPTRAESEFELVDRYQVEVKRADGKIEHLGYVRKYRVKPAGYRPGTYPSLPVEYYMYKVYDDNDVHIGRIDDGKEVTAYLGGERQEYKGAHTLMHALKILFGESALANVYLAPVDIYRD